MNLNLSFFDIEEIFNKYYDKTIDELKSIFEISSNSKSINNMIINAILKKHLSEIEYREISKNFNIKTVNMKRKKIKESMSFPKIDYSDIYTKDWKNSIVYRYFSKKFIICVFVNDSNNKIFDRIIEWELAEDEMYKIFIVWDVVKTMLVNNSVEIGGKYGFSILNFPQKKDYPFMHIRPHDSDMKRGRNILPNGKYVANYCFWLNNKYLEKICNRGVGN